MRTLREQIAIRLLAETYPQETGPKFTDHDLETLFNSYHEDDRETLLAHADRILHIVKERVKGVPNVFFSADLKDGWNTAIVYVLEALQ